MTDRELLEYASKAAGIVGSWEKDTSYMQDREYFNVPYDSHGMLTGFRWDPRKDDGDAHRLGCTLAIDILHRFVGGQRVEALAPGGQVVIEHCSTVDRASATRRAIIRAAAEIGKAMK